MNVEAEAIVVWGAGGHAKVVAQSLRRDRRWRVHGFIDDVDATRAGTAFAGAPVLGTRAVLDALRAQGIGSLALAFGDNAARLALRAELPGRGFRLPALVDAHAVVAEDAVLGEGCYVAAGAIVQPGARIGACAIVNSGAVVEHDAEVGDGVHLSPRACLAGHVRVGALAWIGAGALLRDRVHVGAGALVGMGAVVVSDVPAGMLVRGVPARVVGRADTAAP